MKPQKFLIAVSLVSTLSCILLTISFATDHWIEANAVLTENVKSNISYGLFKGTVERNKLELNEKYEVKLICDFKANACMYSCQKDLNRRKLDLEHFLHHQDLEPCKENVSIYALKSNYNFQKVNTSASSKKIKYIAATIHLCCVMFLSLGLFFSFISWICSFINLRWHPTERLLNIYGLYIWNSIAAGCNFWSVALWTALFLNHLRFNIAITDTLRQKFNFNSQGDVKLGYSYYFLWSSILLNIINIVLLFLRRYNMERQTNNSLKDREFV